MEQFLPIMKEVIADIHASATMDAAAKKALVNSIISKLVSVSTLSTEEKQLINTILLFFVDAGQGVAKVIEKVETVEASVAKVVAPVLAEVKTSGCFSCLGSSAKKT